MSAAETHMDLDRITHPRGWPRDPISREQVKGASCSAASRTVELARLAIRSWRHLAGLNNSPKEATPADNRSKVLSQAEFVLAE